MSTQMLLSSEFDKLFWKLCRKN